MTTVNDPKEYPSNDTDGEIVKTVTIPGQAGKQIKIEGFTIQLANEKSGIVTNAIVSIDYTDKKFDAAAWGASTGSYTALSYNKYSYTATVGKNVILRWKLKTANAKYAAKMRNAAYIFSYVDVGGTPDTPTEESKSYLVIECKESEVSTLTAKIKELAPSAGINILNEHQK